LSQNPLDQRRSAEGQDTAEDHQAMIVPPMPPHMRMMMRRIRIRAAQKEEKCGSVRWVATADGLFFANGQNEGPIEHERGHGCSTGCCPRYDSCTIPGEMICPSLRSWVEERHLLT
jgi:hypothetical protein